MSATTIPTKAGIADLVSKVCACGSRKTARNSLCRAHFMALPKVMRHALYKRCGEGYEEAYADALAFHKLTSPALAAESEVVK